MKPTWIFCALISFWAFAAPAQDKLKIKFGSVSPDDFKPTVYAVDSNASAVVLADIGSTEIVGNTKGSFSLEFKNYRRAHILDKKGFGIADVEIRLYTNGDDEEQLQNLKAVTYNLENGKVVETKLDMKNALFKDKINKNLVIRKFTFPNIKPGSIIEYEYKVISDFVFNLQPWEFQGQYPRLWSEYNWAQPSFYAYVTLTQGYHSYHIRTTNDSRRTFNISNNRGVGQTERGDFSANVTEYRWVMKDVPALKEESFTSALSNHIARIEFQMSHIGEPFTYQQVMSTWPIVVKRLLESEDFGSQLGKDNGWLNDAYKQAVGNAAPGLEQARSIYAWVRDHFTCTNYNRKYLEKPLKEVLKAKSGNVAEINLLLTLLLRKADIAADPVLLSTRSHGYTHSVYPLLDRFNYVICRGQAGGQIFFLDASEPALGFGKLGYKCYNGHARVISPDAMALNMDASSLNEYKNTLVMVINDEKGQVAGRIQQTEGYVASTGIRNLVKEKGKGQLQGNIQKGMGDPVKITMLQLDSLDKYDEPVKLTWDFEFPKAGEDIIYFNPMLGEEMKENPFKSAERFYPVELPYAINEIYTLQMDIPAGYVVDELPKSITIKFNEQKDALFEYRISVSGESISLRSWLQVKRTFFPPEEYEVLREFFGLIVKKQNEQIVFKKKTNP